MIELSHLPASPQSTTCPSRALRSARPDTAGHQASEPVRHPPSHRGPRVVRGLLPSCEVFAELVRIMPDGDASEATIKVSVTVLGVRE